jgi:hypothetical protein
MKGYFNTIKPFGKRIFSFPRRRSQFFVRFGIFSDFAALMSLLEDFQHGKEMSGDGKEADVGK